MEIIEKITTETTFKIDVLEGRRKPKKVVRKKNSFLSKLGGMKGGGGLGNASKDPTAPGGAQYKLIQFFENFLTQDDEVWTLNIDDDESMGSIFTQTENLQFFLDFVLHPQKHKTTINV